MKELRVSDIIKLCDGKLICGNEEELCENFSKDTRQITAGDVYVGIKGEKFDGSLFYEDALKQGAKVCMLEEIDIQDDIISKYQNSTIVTVKDTVKALQKLASYKRSLYDIPVIAITGSVRKNKHKRYGSKCSYDII